MMESNVMEGGEKVLVMKIAQGKAGIELHLRAHPLIEDFFRSGSQKDLAVAGTGHGCWTGIGNDKLMMYHLAGPRGSYTNSNYTLEYPGYHLQSTDEIGLGINCVNLSFLRLKGISEPGGVKLNIAGVTSLNARRDFRDSVRAAVGRFVRDYLVPVTLELEIKVGEKLGG